MDLTLGSSIKPPSKSRDLFSRRGRPVVQWGLPSSSYLGRVLESPLVFTPLTETKRPCDFPLLEEPVIRLHLRALQAAACGSGRGAGGGDEVPVMANRTVA